MCLILLGELDLNVEAAVRVQDGERGLQGGEGVMVSVRLLRGKGLHAGRLLGRMVDLNTFNSAVQRSSHATKHQVKYCFTYISFIQNKIRLISIG